MTTVVSDGVQIASDSQTTAGGERSGDFTKVVVDGHIVYCFAGPCYLFPLLIRWYQQGAFLEDRPSIEDDTTHSFWVIGDDPGPQAFANIHKCPYPEPLTFPSAIGSGRKYALGALLAGADLATAVGIAAQLDVYTGGEIRVTDIPEKPQSEAKPSTCFTAIRDTLGQLVGRSSTQ